MLNEIIRVDGDSRYCPPYAGVRVKQQAGQPLNTMQINNGQCCEEKKEIDEYFAEETFDENTHRNNRLRVKVIAKTMNIRIVTNIKQLTEAYYIVLIPVIDGKKLLFAKTTVHPKNNSSSQ